jgi:hypothetical protein
MLFIERVLMVELNLFLWSLSWTEASGAGAGAGECQLVQPFFVFSEYHLGLKDSSLVIVLLCGTKEEPFVSPH